MRSEPKCPKCGGLDGYEQIKNVVRGAGWYVRGQDMRVLFCRICDVEMIDYELINPDKPQDPKQTRLILIVFGIPILLVGLWVLTDSF
jgi:hypothetical protein